MSESPSGARLERLRLRLAEGEDAPDAFLVTNDENRRYLSGFTGSAGSLLITSTAARLLTDFRYVEQGAAQAPQFQVVKVTGAPWPAVAEQARELGLRRLGFESEDVSVDSYDQLQDAIAAGGAAPDAPKVELVPLKGLVEGLRQVKSAAEVEAIRRAVEIGDRAFERVAAGLRPGVSEREVAWRLEVAMREMGAEGLSFPIIVAAGTNGAMPHHRPTDHPIRAGEPVVIDMGCKVDGYCSDMTRTISLGSPQGPFWLVYDTVLRAQQACIAGLKAGPHREGRGRPGPGHHRQGGARRALRARHRARRGAGHPRAASPHSHPGGGGASPCGHRGDGGAGDLPPRLGRREDRGHGGRRRGPLPGVDHGPQGPHRRGRLG